MGWGLIAGSVFFVLAFCIPIWNYLRTYAKAQKEWIKRKAKVTGLKGYPRSYGIVPEVTFTIGDTTICTEVIRAQFSHANEEEIIEVYSNPENVNECLMISSAQRNKNRVSLILLTLLSILSALLGVLELLK